MRLERDDDEILSAKIHGVVAAGHAHGLGLTFDLQREPLAANRVEMCATRDQADVNPRLGETESEIAADRAGAEDAYLHDLQLRHVKDR